MYRLYHGHTRRPFAQQKSYRTKQTRLVLEPLEDRCLLDSSPPIIPNLTPTPQLTASTVPPNGDVNPYGVAFVPQGFVRGGLLHPGDILVSNFNDRSNLQGTGTTIVDISPSGSQSVFFKGPSKPGELGLTTALGVLQSGFVIVGSVPTRDGTSATVQAPGSLLILNRSGHVVETLSNAASLDGPWDLTVNDQGSTAQVFVANVLSGTVTRIDLQIPNGGNPVVASETQIASGYLTRPDPAALLVGPTGLAYDAARDLLYVASTGDNAIFAISKAASRMTDARMGRLIYQDAVHLHGPLGLVLDANGDLISSQGDAVNPDPNQPSELVEFTPGGRFVAQRPVDSSGQQGGAFGIALQSSGGQITFAAVDDIFNTLEVWTINQSAQASGTAATVGIPPAATMPDPVLSTNLIAPTDSSSRAVPSLSAAGQPTAASQKSLSALPNKENVGGVSRPSALVSGFARSAHKAAVDSAFGDLALTNLPDRAPRHDPG